MNISYNWLKQYIDFEKTPEELSVTLTDIGLEVEALEKVEGVPGGLEGLVVGEVKTCVQHPDADRLCLTTVDIGQEKLLHIVCGAPNVAVGQKVIVAQVGATLYPTEGEPFTIKKSKIRGEVSEGMICAEDEMGMGEGHDGILVLPDETPVGTPAKTYFGIVDDFVFEIGLTPNRADAASHYGVARDIAAYLRTDCALPSVAVPEGQKRFPVRVESDACKRYSSLLIEGVKVGPSPDWLKEKLVAIGVRPINNIVDVTNFVLHGIGQPLHAFDASKIAGDEIVVRNARAGERFVTLDGVERTLHADDLMICDVAKPLCIAGVFGGADSGVSETTNRVFLESAYFDSVSVRKTSRRHGLKTDASFRYERGTDPDIPVYALHYAAQLIIDVAGGQVTTATSDIYPVKVQPFEFHVDCNRVRSLIGKQISDVEIREIIRSLGIQVLSEEEEGLQVAVPPYRVDVTREVDVIEEVLRIYGYNRVEIGSQLRSSLNVSKKPDPEVVQEQIADLLVGNGYYEIMTNSLTKQAYTTDPQRAVQILNPLSSDLDTMRQELVYSMLEAVAHNQKRKFPDLKLFEFGRTYQRAENGEYEERLRLGLMTAGKEVQGQWNTKDQASDFYHLKAAVDAVLNRLGITDLRPTDADEPHFAYGLTYVRHQKPVVSFGALHQKTLALADVAGDVYFADFDWNAVSRIIRKNKIVYREIPKFPQVRRDLALLVDASVRFDGLKQIALRTERKLLKAVNVFDVYTGDRLPDGKKSYALSFLIQDDEKTLGEKQIDAVIKKLILNFEKELGATVRTR